MGDLRLPPSGPPRTLASPPPQGHTRHPGQGREREVNVRLGQGLLPDLASTAEVATRELAEDFGAARRTGGADGRRDRPHGPRSAQPDVARHAAAVRPPARGTSPGPAAPRLSASARAPARRRRAAPRSSRPRPVPTRRTDPPAPTRRPGRRASRPPARDRPAAPARRTPRAAGRGGPPVAQPGPEASGDRLIRPADAGPAPAGASSPPRGGDVPPAATTPTGRAPVKKRRSPTSRGRSLEPVKRALPAGSTTARPVRDQGAGLALHGLRPDRGLAGPEQLGDRLEGPAHREPGHVQPAVTEAARGDLGDRRLDVMSRPAGRRGRPRRASRWTRPWKRLARPSAAFPPHAAADVRVEVAGLTPSRGRPPRR